jgi:hypothetical protein
MPADSVDLVVTSPPYDDLRTYGGHSWDFERLANELHRVMKPGGVVVWNVADGVVDGFKTLSSMKQAIHFDSIGLKMHDSMVYEKSGVAYPDSTRYLQVAEWVWVMSKGKPKTTNLLRDRPNKYVGKMGGNKRGGGCANVESLESASTCGDTPMGGTTPQKIGAPTITLQSCPKAWRWITSSRGAIPATWCLIRSQEAERR